MKAHDEYDSADTLDVSIMKLTLLWAKSRSKDPNTKVGAAVYDHKTKNIFLGYNGFNTGMPDCKAIWDNRDSTKQENKYLYVVHAETNAIRKAHMSIGMLDGCTLYVTHFPCHHCMKDSIVPSGIKSIVYNSDYPPNADTVRMLYIHGITLQRMDVQC